MGGKFQFSPENQRFGRLALEGFHPTLSGLEGPTHVALIPTNSCVGTLSRAILATACSVIDNCPCTGPR